MAVTLDKPYCSLLDVQYETKASGSEHDDKYHTAINLASRWIERWCRRDFQSHDHSSGLYVPRGWVLEDVVFFPWPVLTLTELAVYADKSDGPDASDIWDAEDYYIVGQPLDAANGKVESESGAFGSYPFKEHMQVKGTFGYATADDETPSDDLPAGVRRACALIAAAFSNEKHVEQVGFDGVKTELLDNTVPTEATRLLQQFLNHNQQF
jgi:hypothetical protein